MVQVYKFGGASVKNAERVRNVVSLVEGNKSLVVVVSALGKTTNELEEVVKAYLAENDNAIKLFEEIKTKHYNLCLELGLKDEVLSDLNDIFVTIDWILEEEVQDTADYIYDQIVSVGELASSKILHGALLNAGMEALWLDVRDVLITDENYRQANIDLVETEQRVKKVIGKSILEEQVVITQGFIGSTPDNYTTTLGREGSDYTGAVLAAALNAEKYTIWKDVPGFMTGDPDLYTYAQTLPFLSYLEALEMAYYGAKIIHPNTIKPLQNHGIPLYVKSFLDPGLDGTLIAESVVAPKIPMVIFENNQAVVTFRTRDYSFINEAHLSQILSAFHVAGLKINIMRKTATSFVVGVPEERNKIRIIKEEMDAIFQVNEMSGCDLITIRHFDTDTYQSLIYGKEVIFEDKLLDIIQIVVK